MKVIPTITIGFENFKLGNRDNWSALATEQEYNSTMDYYENLVNNKPGKIPAILKYAWNEWREAAGGICPCVNADGSLDTILLDVTAEFLA